VQALNTISARIRGRVIELSHKAGTPHLGSSLSCVDLMVALYWKVLSIDPKKPEAQDRDRFILSKGHSATALYSILAERGFISNEILASYAKEGSSLAEQPSPQCVPGVEAATGSLGHGLPIGIGMALAGKILEEPFKVFVLMSDGECNEGSVWEGAMFAPAHKLSNLCVIVDFNKWQATGRSTEVLNLESLQEKFKAFGWETAQIDGHNFDEILGTLERFPSKSGKPFAIVADTIKGKGVSFMEDDNNWHYRIPTEDELRLARAELGL
jgi:transketolase